MHFILNVSNSYVMQNVIYMYALLSYLIEKNSQLRLFYSPVDVSSKISSKKEVSNNSTNLRNEIFNDIALLKESNSSTFIKCNNLLVLGDMNVRTSMNGDEKSCRFGRKFIDDCNSNEFIIINSLNNIVELASDGPGTHIDIAMMHQQLLITHYLDKKYIFRI